MTPTPMKIISSHQTWGWDDSQLGEFVPASSSPKQMARSDSNHLALEYVAYEKREAAVANALGKRRGGGGGGGRGGGGGVSSSGGRGGSSSTSGSSASSGGGRTYGSGTKGFSPGSVSGGSSVYGTSAASGVRTPYTVSSGSFAGRSAGGGLRGDVYGGGSRAYGSGYPLAAGAVGGAGLYAGASVASRGFPYVYCESQES
jgi:hypothetical protein